MKVGTRSTGQGGDWSTAVRRMRNRAQCPPRNPGSAALVPGNRPPTSRAYAFAAPVNATANRPGTGDYDQSRLAFGGAVERNVCIADDHNFSNTQHLERITHAGTQLRAAGA